MDSDGDDNYHDDNDGNDDEDDDDDDLKRVLLTMLGPSWVKELEFH